MEDSNMKNKEMREARTATTNNAFTEALRRFETAYRLDKDSQAYAEALNSLATAVAYSVLKKCIDVSQNPQLKEVRASIARDTARLEAIRYSGAHAFETVFTSDGDMARKTVDSSMRDAQDKLASECLGDGLDLVNTAIISILGETAKAIERGELDSDFLEKPYTVRRLKKKVWIKSEDSVGGWETAETTPIQEVYKEVRRAIDASRAMSTDARNGYSYLEELSYDAESDAESVIYRRLSKYADLGGYATDFNGACTLYSADSQTADDMDTLIELLELTARQAQVLKLRLSGHGEKAIATYLGVKRQSVQDVLKAIQQKTLKAGLKPRF